MAYRDDVPSGGGLDGLAGFHIKKGVYPHSTQFLSDDGPTIFRILPEFLNGVEQPMRFSAEKSDFSSWIKGEKLVKMMGINNKFTCLLRVYGKDPKYEGPIENFAKTMQSAIAESPRSFPEEWELAVKGRKNMGSKIPRVDTHALVQAIVYRVGGKDLLGPDKQPKPKFPCIMVLGKSARYSLENICNDQVPGYTGNPEDYASRFKCGDIVSSAGGRFVQFSYVPSGNNSTAHYDMDVLGGFPVDPGWAKTQYASWEQLLELLTEEQQFNLLLSHFPAPMLDYALKGTQWHSALPVSVKGAYAAMCGGGAGTVSPGTAGYGSAPVQQPQPPVPAGWPAPAPGYRYACINGQWLQEPIPPITPPPPPAAPAPGAGFGAPGAAPFGAPAAAAYVAPAPSSSSPFAAPPGAQPPQTPPAGPGAPTGGPFMAPPPIPGGGSAYARDVQQPFNPGVAPTMTNVAPAPDAAPWEGAPGPSPYGPLPTGTTAAGAPPPPPPPSAPGAPAGFGGPPGVNYGAPVAPAVSPALAGAGAFGAPPVSGAPSAPPPPPTNVPVGDPAQSVAMASDARKKLADARAAAEAAGKR